MRQLTAQHLRRARAHADAGRGREPQRLGGRAACACTRRRASACATRRAAPADHGASRPTACPSSRSRIRSCATRSACCAKPSLSTKSFREITAELGRLLTYEATADFPLESVPVQCWSGPVEVERISGKKVTVVPILRAGLGMLEGVLDTIPNAKVSVVGIARNHATLQPEPYVDRLAGDLHARTAIVLDPMLATGGSMNSRDRAAQVARRDRHPRARARRRAGRHRGADAPRIPTCAAGRRRSTATSNEQRLHHPRPRRRRRPHLRHALSDAAPAARPSRSAPTTRAERRPATSG